MSDKREGLIKEFLDMSGCHGKFDANYMQTPRRFISVWNAIRNVEAPQMKCFPLKGKASLILIKGYEAWSMCPHHLLPVKYTFKIGYIPQAKVVGLSKLPRLADYVLRCFPLQEEIANEVTHRLDEALDPKGAGCIVHGEHLCMQMRGIKSPCITAASSSFTGIFLLLESSRHEFLAL